MTNSFTGRDNARRSIDRHDEVFFFTDRFLRFLFSYQRRCALFKRPALGKQIRGNWRHPLSFSPVGVARIATSSGASGWRRPSISRNAKPTIQATGTSQGELPCLDIVVADWVMTKCHMPAFYLSPDVCCYFWWDFDVALCFTLTCFQVVWVLAMGLAVPVSQVVSNQAVGTVRQYVIYSGICT